MQIMTELTVLMPVYNCEEYITHSICSILSQTYTDFKFYILDDGSSDSSIDIINKFKEIDSRIYVFKNKENLGIKSSRQQLIDLVKTDFFAWMDADDIAPSNRLNSQMSKIKVDDTIGVVSGFNASLQGECEKLIPLSSEEVLARLIVGNVISNMAIVRHSDFIKSGFSFLECEVDSASDYALWVAMSRVCKIIKLSMVCNYYRRHPRQESTLNIKKQQYSGKKICGSCFSHLGVSIPPDLTHSIRLFPNEVVKPSIAKKILNIYRETIRLNKKKKMYVHRYLVDALADSYRRHCRCFGLYGVWIFIQNFGFNRFLKGEKLGFSFIKYCWKKYS